MRSRIIGALATLILLLALSTTAFADDRFSATLAFPDDPGIPDGSY
ncbi:MAG: hypothetical protein NVSMB8_00350 [Candidatus Limnocylindrales bacterium]